MRGVGLLNLLSANEIIKLLNKKRLTTKKGRAFKKSNFSHLKSKGMFKVHKKVGSSKSYYLFEEVKQALIDNGIIDSEIITDVSEIEKIKEDPLSLLSACNQLPIEQTIAGLSEEERERQRVEELKRLAQLKELENISKLEDVDDAPKFDDTQAEWNKYWIMEKGLKTALERKRLEGTLIPVDEAKALIERFIRPIARKMDDLAYDLKNNFPMLDIAVIEYVSSYTNKIKEDAQKDVI